MDLLLPIAGILGIIPMTFWYLVPAFNRLGAPPKNREEALRERYLCGGLTLREYEAWRIVVARPPTA
ncbi:MAG: hypothetical protein EXR47_02575 [Dehalococcoidia bacterium]|nr:hypothetical protein [Dehalococcoidia bacterium]